MKRKILLFNYFIQKCLDKEKELLRTNNFESLMLGLIAAKTTMFYRTDRGCSSRTVYIVYPNFLQELFVYLCLDASEHGDNLFDVFNFQKTYSNCFQHGKGENWTDADLTLYLDHIYPVEYPLQEKTRASYFRIFDCIPQEVMEPGSRNSHLRRVLIDALEVCPKNEYTTMIDRAFERLCTQKDFENMLKRDGKYDLYAKSLPYAKYATALATRAM